MFYILCLNIINKIVTVNKESLRFDCIFLLKIFVVTCLMEDEICNTHVEAQFESK
jgi:hypothetical protein